MKKISKPNRRRKFDDKGLRKVGMPMDGASVRDLERIRQGRAEGLSPAKKKRAV